MKKHIKIISWNVNGIRAIEKKGFIDWFLDVKPNIMCMQETKAMEEQVPEKILNLNDYSKIFSSAEKKGYSGVGIITNIKLHSHNTMIGIDKFDREGRILRMDCNDFILYNVYFPNGKASPERLKYKMDFYMHFSDMMKKHLKKRDKIIICGDVNTAHREIDLKRPKENEKSSGFLPKERKWIDELLNMGFLDTFRVFNEKPNNYSWWDYKTRARERNVGWRLDYFFISENLRKNLKGADILSDIYGSDHCPISIDMSF